MGFREVITDDIKHQLWLRITAAAFRVVMEETQLVVSGNRRGNSMQPQDGRRLVTSLKSSKCTTFFSAVWNSGGVMKPAGPGTISGMLHLRVYVAGLVFEAYKTGNR